MAENAQYKKKLGGAKCDQTEKLSNSLRMFEERKPPESVKFYSHYHYLLCSRKRERERERSAIISYIKQQKNKKKQTYKHRKMLGRNDNNIYNGISLIKYFPTHTLYLCFTCSTLRTVPNNRENSLAQTSGSLGPSVRPQTCAHMHCHRMIPVWNSVDHPRNQSHPQWPPHRDAAWSMRSPGELVVCSDRSPSG